MGMTRMVFYLTRDHMASAAQVQILSLSFLPKFFLGLDVKLVLSFPLLTRELRWFELAVREMALWSVL